MPGFFDNSSVEWDPGRRRPIKVTGRFDLPQAPTPVDRIKRFLTTHVQDLRLQFPVDGLTLRHEGTTPVRTVYRFQPSVDGIPILDAELLVHTDKQQRVLEIDNTAGATNVIAPPAGARVLAPDEAFKAASAALGAYTRRVDTPAPSLAWFPTKAGLARAYLVTIAAANPPRDWEIVVDAYSGRVLRQRNLIREADGTGMVFDPNPVVTAGSNALRDPTATLAGCGFAGTAQATIDHELVTRTLQDLTVTPAGNYQLKGPYCEVHNFANPNSVLPEEPTGHFDYHSDNERFEAVMVYYHIDTYQRYLQSLGITNAHPTAIQCDPHDNSITAAWYSPLDGGLHFSDSGACKPDRAEDADCMIHEYGHAIQDYQVPGWGGSNPATSRDETGAMGEGFGDFAACVYFADRNGGFQREVFEDWVFGPGGLRRVDGTKVYPYGTTGVVAPWTSSVHANGEIWSAALWNIYRAIGGDSPSAAAHEAARQAMLRSVIHSHPLLAATASMPDGAEAVMRTNAELEEYRGKHLMQMLDSFHDRGILPVDPGANLFIRDDVADPGTESYHAPVFWDSPDVWVRNADDNGTTHQEPIAGHDNWFYARVRNRGTAPCRALAVTFNLKAWLGTQFVYPADFVPFISAAPAFNLAPGATTIVKAKWPAALVPASGTHGCLLVSAYTPREHVPAGTHVWDHGNLAQKNLHVVAASPGDSVTVPFRIGSRFSLRREVFRFEIRRSSPELGVSLLGERAVLHRLLQAPAGIAADPTLARNPAVLSVTEPTRLALSHASMASPVSLTLERGSRIELGAHAAVPDRSRAEFLKADVEPVTDANHELEALRFLPGKVVGLPIELKARQDLGFTLKIDVPRTARSGTSEVLDVVQCDATGRSVGGLRIKIVVK